MPRGKKPKTRERERERHLKRFEEELLSKKDFAFRIWRVIRLRYFEFSSDRIDRIPFSYGKTEFLNLEFLQDRSNFYFFVYV